MRTYVLLLLLTFFTAKANSQSASFCGTNEGICFYDTIVSNPQQNTRAITSIVARVSVHIVRETNGSGGLDYNEMTETVNEMIAFFAQYDICIIVKSIDEIKNSFIYNSSWTWYDGGNNNGKPDAYEQYCNIDAIDVFFFGHDRVNMAEVDGVGRGTATIIGGTQTHQGIEYNVTNGKILAHEIGHILGLYHTFRGCGAATKDIDPIGGGACLEIGNSNCEICGDIICDTPPNPVTNSNCIDPISCVAHWLSDGTASLCVLDEITFNSKVSNPVFFNNTNNIMSYTPVSCMNILTDGQLARIRLVVNTAVEYQRPLSNVVVLRYEDDYNEIYGYRTISNLTLNAGEAIIEEYVNTTFDVSDLMINNGALVSLRTNEEIIINELIVDGDFFADATEFCESESNLLRIAETNNQYTALKIYKEDKLLGIKLYPIPASNFINIDIVVNEQCLIDISVFDVSGTQLKTLLKNQLYEKGDYKTTTDISYLQPGLYIVYAKIRCISDNKSQSEYFKMIFQ